MLLGDFLYDFSRLYESLELLWDHCKLESDETATPEVVKGLNVLKESIENLAEFYSVLSGTDEFKLNSNKRVVIGQDDLLKVLYLVYPVIDTLKHEATFQGVDAERIYSAKVCAISYIINIYVGWKKLANKMISPQRTFLTPVEFNLESEKLRAFKVSLTGEGGMEALLEMYKLSEKVFLQNFNYRYHLDAYKF